jgi:enoyl-CoA hydratase/carnithine racemase
MRVVQGVWLDIAGRAAVITIARPHVRNAIALQTISELEDALDDVAASDAAVLVLTGAGDRAFISGGDLKDLDRLRSLDEAAAMAGRMRDVLDRMAALPIPVVAALNGHALGGGAEVALAADIRVAAEDVKLGFTQSTLGIMPAWGGAERLTALVGRSRAMLLLTSGCVVSARDALAIGLVDRVVPRAAFEHEWRSLTASIAAAPADAIRAIKSLVSLVHPAVHPATRDAAVRRFAELWVAPEHWNRRPAGTHPDALGDRVAVADGVGSSRISTKEEVTDAPE